MPSLRPAIARIDAASLREQLDGLVELLVDAVENGSSVGFVLPLSRAEAAAYWLGLAPSLADGSRLLWITRDATGVLGTVQLELATKKNGINRAEVQKLLVHTRARRNGVARALMQTVEARARELRRGLLYLDTEAGSDAEHFYRSVGYTCIGGLPEYACSPRGEWRANAIYYKTLFSRGADA
jgi:acetyltransferase